MREIKFRVWDEKTKKFILVIDFSQNPLCWADKMHADYSLSQYTGLKDKNGKEIYEKDFLRHPDSGLVYCIRWNTDTASYEFYKADESDSLMAHFKSMANYCEVIGNIYSNPELIKLLCKKKS